MHYISVTWKSDSGGNESGKKAVGLTSKTTTLYEHHTFCTIVLDSHVFQNFHFLSYEQGFISTHLIVVLHLIKHFLSYEQGFISTHLIVVLHLIKHYFI